MVSAPRRTIRILLGGEAREITDIDPNRTLLQYLREDQGLTGTKEGCAEGDCGACTVLLGEAEDGFVRYRPINACIQFLAAVDGKQVIAVEHLADGTKAHPVQQAMIDHHGAQCGFCTPGFVMSLMALHLDDQPATRQAIDDAQAGNLCRCTGYGPIIDAARDSAEAPRTEAWQALEETGAKVLADWAGDEQALEVAGYGAPRSGGELAELLARTPDAVLFAGATDVGLWVTKLGRRLDPLVYVGGIDELKQIRRADGRIEIGAAVTYGEAEAALGAIHPDLAELVRRIGALQVRNAGTIAGNIANGSPIADMPPPLIALGAELVLRSAGGRRLLALEDFFIDYGEQDLRPGEFVEAVRLPEKPSGAFACYKISKRFDQDISAVLAAFHVGIAEGVVTDARIAYGGMAATPKRASAAEAALTGQAWNEAAVRAAQAALASDFTPITDMRASAGYRMKVAQNLLWKFYLEQSGASATRLALRSRAGHG